MINLRKAQESFKEYLKDYDIEDGNIKLKIRHTYEVVNKSEYISKGLGLNQENIELAKLIALLHDIGRFEQIKEFGEFNDKKIEHAEFGVKALFDNGLIRNFIEEDRYDRIIELAIINHNRDNKDITKDINDKEKLHIKLIRDSDKTDILYILTFEDEKSVWESEKLEEEKFTDEIYREFVENHNIIYRNRKTHADTLVCHFAYAFDFNFNYGLKYVLDNKYYDKLYKRFNFKDKETKNRFENIYNITNSYIKEKLKEK